MPDAPSQLSLAVAAKLHNQACCYTDSRVSQLARHINSMQAELHKQAERVERKRSRVRLVDRLMFLVLGTLTGYAIKQFGLVGALAVVAGIAPDTAREIFEFFKRV